MRFRFGLCLLFLLVLGGGSCLDTSGKFTNEGTPDAGGPDGPVFSAADIGTPCEYDPSVGTNPTNTCAQGLTCLIYTSDARFVPFPPGGNQNFTLSEWEDQFTRYRFDGIDEGYCTLVGTWDNPPACPVGTSLKLLATNLAVCVRQCTQPADCGRPGYTCDLRYLDLGGGHCVRACTLDFPDCVRSGHLVFQDPQGGQSQIGFYLAADDLAGASMCDTGTGICIANPGGGSQGPGQLCATTADCALDSVCIQGDVLRAMDPLLPETTPGFCAQPCRPRQPNEPPETPTGCGPGFACQQGFRFGHGPPFAVVSTETGQPLEAGGFCFPSCQQDPQICNAYPPTSCGQAESAVFGDPWNNESMCLIDPLRR